MDNASGSRATRRWQDGCGTTCSLLQRLTLPRSKGTYRVFVGRRNPWGPCPATERASMQTDPGGTVNSARRATAGRCVPATRRARQIPQNRVGRDWVSPTDSSHVTSDPNWKRGGPYDRTGSSWMAAAKPMRAGTRTMNRHRPRRERAKGHADDTGRLRHPQTRLLDHGGWSDSGRLTGPRPPCTQAHCCRSEFRTEIMRVEVRDPTTTRSTTPVSPVRAVINTVAWHWIPQALPSEGRGTFSAAHLVVAGMAVTDPLLQRAIGNCTHFPARSATEQLTQL